MKKEEEVKTEPAVKKETTVKAENAFSNFDFSKQKMIEEDDLVIPTPVKDFKGDLQMNFLVILAGSTGVKQRDNLQVMLWKGLGDCDVPGFLLHGVSLTVLQEEWNLPNWR